MASLLGNRAGEGFVLQNQARAVRQEKMPCSAEPGKSWVERTRQVLGGQNQPSLGRTRQDRTRQSEMSI